MNPQKVTSMFGLKCTADVDQREFYKYCNKDKKIYWSAPTLNMDDDSMFNEFVTYVETGTVDNMEMRCEAFQNPLISAYFHYYDYRPEIHDSNREIWKGLVQYVKDHQSEFFDRYGDWKDDLKITEDMIRKWIK